MVNSQLWFCRTIVSGEGRRRKLYQPKADDRGDGLGISLSLEMEPSTVGGTRALADAASQLLLRAAAATVIGTAPSHDGAVILDGSSVQCWVSTLSRRLG